ncbi:hypothetical protein PL8927_790205 [Planktothrix serta PCC 8927]|uniref:Uncharacterized protein n=1 Tax=Planktothrix serta PCC 8927 TaxID=671068 RepID=A0A7Z9C2D2_9CYAN|nr:hypothetical protein PL8927_790205 [Planktothrix serta PCC 8927]
MHFLDFLPKILSAKRNDGRKNPPKITFWEIIEKSLINFTIANG